LINPFAVAGYQLIHEDYSQTKYSGQQDKYVWGMQIEELGYSPVSNHPYPSGAQQADPHSKHTHLGKQSGLRAVATREWILQSNEVLFPFAKFVHEGGLKAFDIPMFPQKDANNNWVPSPQNTSTFRNPIIIAEHQHYVVGSAPNAADRTVEDRYAAKLVTGGGLGWNYEDENGQLQTATGLLPHVDNQFIVQCPAEFQKNITLTSATASIVDANNNTPLASSAPSYTDMVLASGLVQHSSLTPQYTVASIGGARLVQFHGAVKKSSGSFKGYSTIMTITDTAARPTKTQMFKVPAYPGGSAFGFVEIYSDGRVMLDMDTAFSTSSISRLYL